MNENSITGAVQERYGKVALQVLGKQVAATTSPSAEPEGSSTTEGEIELENRISSGLYSQPEAETLPPAALAASLGCGNPTALAKLLPGQVVLDLGSGGGVDVLLSARRVGPTGYVYGVDMTEEMLELARQNAVNAGVSNVTFLKGDIAALPLPDASVDVIISNCVINLASDKSAVFKEAFRVLKPGGQLAVSDIVMHGEIPQELRAGFREIQDDLAAWSGCMAGVLDAQAYLNGLTTAGFSEPGLEIVRRYALEDLGRPLPAWLANFDEVAISSLVSLFASTFVRAVKP